MKKYPVSLLLLATLFTIKALYLAFFITPLWDIPDETGHFSSVRDFATGKGIPLLGKATIGADVIANASGNPDAEATRNWIAQHPPVYHMIAAIPLRIAMYFTDDQEICYRVPRLVAALSGGLLILVLFSAMRTAGLDKQRSTILAAAIGFIPMVSHLASGTSHDISILLTAALSSLFFIRFLKKHRIRDAYISAAWLTFAAGMKMTVWVLIPPLLAIFALEMFVHIKPWKKHLAGIALTMSLLPLLWMLRNYYYFSNFTQTSVSNAKWILDTPLAVSFPSFLHTTPVVDLFMVYFYGWIGWIGTGIGDVAICVVRGWPLMVFSGVIFLIFLLFAWHILAMSFSEIRRDSIATTNNYLPKKLEQFFAAKNVKTMLFSASLLIAGVISVIAFIFLFKGKMPYTNIRLGAVALLIFTIIPASLLLIFNTSPVDRFVPYALLLLSFFSIILVWEIYTIYLQGGFLRATHGRYFYPVVPFILIALAIVVRQRSIAKLILVIVVAMLAIMEAEAFLQQILPFYKGIVS